MQKKNFLFSFNIYLHVFVCQPFSDLNIETNIQCTLNIYIYIYIYFKGNSDCL